MTSFYPTAGFQPSSFKQSTLIVPAISLGNVPQLTSDLLISSLGLKRVGFVGKGDTVAPFSGKGDAGEIVTGGLEVYGNTGSELYVIQQRSPTLKTKKDEHVSLMNEFVRGQSFGTVLILASLDAASQDDAQLITPHQRVLPPSSSSSSAANSASSSSSSSAILARLEKLLPPLRLNIAETPYAPPPVTPTSASGVYPPFLPAAGLTRRLLSSLHGDDGQGGGSASVPHGAITTWCVEGDNRGDAIELVRVVLSVLGIENDVQLTEPPSWTGLFGTTHGWSGGSGQDSELYG